MRTVIFFLFLLVSFSFCFAEVIHVPGDYPTIQEGIDAANPGDIVMVAAGVYYEEIVLKADVVVMGAGEGLSIIDGGGDAGDVVRAIGNGITNTTVLQGFTVTGADNNGGMPGGGGIFCNSGAAPEICNNRVEGNDQGIVMWNQSAAFLHNNVVIDNTYTGISISSAAQVINNTVANNNNGMYDSGGWLPTIMNNVVTGNSNIGLGCVNNSVPTDFSYNDVWGNGNNYHNCSAGPGSISEDPVYVDESNGDYHLDVGSSCIDAGNPAAQYNDPDGSRNDMGAYGGPGATVTIPQVSLTSPARNELNVNYSSDVSAVFTVDMNKGTITPLSFKLVGHLTGYSSGTVSYDSAAKMVTLNPDNNFRCGEVMTALLREDIESTSGDSLGGFFWQFTARVDDGSGVFTTTANYGMDSQPSDVITGDFNGDGNLDLGVANENSNNVSIRLGNGDGTFASVSHFSAGATPYALHAGDFNEDGNLDIATANGGSNNISLLPGNGDGTFGSPDNYATGTQPNALSSGDFNFDGYLDIAVVNANSNDVSILLNDGFGGFDPPVPYSTGVVPYGIVSGDFDGDGIIDLAVANSGSNNISIMLGIGDGTFSAVSNYTAGTSPYALCIGDYNGDSNLDLGVANNGSNNVSVLLGNGTGGFSSPTNYVTGSGPYAVCTFDSDADGRLDLGVVNSSSDNVSVLLGNGNGTFGASLNYGCGDGPYALTAGDFDNDGDMDLATANNNSDDVSILLNEDALMVTATNPFQYQVVAALSTNISGTFNLAINASSLDSTSFIVYGAQTGRHPGSISYDADSFTATLDPNLDFIEGETITAIFTKAIQATNNVFLRGFSWNFGAEITTPSAGTFGNRQDYWVGNETRGEYAGDFDGDGDIDIAASLNQGAVAVLLNNGDGTFSGPSNYTCSTEPIAIFGGDLDWDGDIDLAVINNRPGNANLDILENNGNATFTLSVTYGLSVMGNSLDGGDLDGDGDIDIVVSSYWGSNNNVYVMLNNGNATFSGPYIYTAGTWAHGVAVKDVDNDGDVDICVVNSGNNNVSILINDGDANFPAPANYAVGSSPYSVYGNDFNGDGFVDLASANYGSDDITVILNNGDGTFANPVSYLTGSSTRYLIGGDFDGDGDIDLAASVNGADTIAVILNNGDGTFGNPAKYQVGTSPWSIQTADFDLDGDLDIACANYNTDNVSILFNTGAAVQEKPVVTLHEPYLTIYPSIFNDRITIDYCVGQNAGDTELCIYDISGRMIKSFSFGSNRRLLAQTISWNGRDEKERIVASGVYFCRLKTGHITLTRKILRIR